MSSFQHIEAFFLCEPADSDRDPAPAPLPNERLAAALSVNGGELVRLSGVLLTLPAGPAQLSVSAEARLRANTILKGIDAFEGGKGGRAGQDGAVAFASPAASPDPALAAVARARETYEAASAVYRAGAEDAFFPEADAEEEAYHALIKTVPTTLAGLAAVVAWVAHGIKDEYLRCAEDTVVFFQTLDEALRRLTGADDVTMFPERPPVLLNCAKMVIEYMTTVELPPYGLLMADDPDDIVRILQEAIKIVEATKGAAS